jgi:hypothetical protein
VVAELDQPELLPQAQRTYARADGVAVEFAGERLGEHVRKTSSLPVKPFWQIFPVKKIRATLTKTSLVIESVFP